MAFSPTLYTTTTTPLPSLSLPHASPSLSAFVPNSTAHSCTRPRAASAKNLSGYLSVLHKSVVEEEEYRKARLEVNRKGTELEGLVVEGFSIGGMETCIVLPSFNSVFDIGRCPSRAINQDYLFITHAHLDHIVSSCSQLYAIFVKFHLIVSMKEASVKCYVYRVNSVLSIEGFSSHVLGNAQPVQFETSNRVCATVYQGGCGETSGNSLYNEQCRA